MHKASHYQKKYEKYIYKTAKYRNKLKALRGGGDTNTPTNTPTNTDAYASPDSYDSYRNYAPSPAGARAFQAQIQQSVEGGAATNTQDGSNTNPLAGERQGAKKSTGNPWASAEQKAGKIVESCLTNCMKDCNYGIPLCISANIDNFAESARNLSNVLSQNNSILKESALTGQALQQAGQTAAAMGGMGPPMGADGGQYQ